MFRWRLFLRGSILSQTTRRWISGFRWEKMSHCWHRHFSRKQRKWWTLMMDFWNDQVIILPRHKIWLRVFVLCSWRCPPPTGRATRPSPSLWLRSWSLAGRRTASSGLRRRSINPVLWSFRCGTVWSLLTSRRCSSSSRQCIRRELFCDGRVNCALGGSKPLDEASCTSTNSPQQDSKSDHWQDSSLPTVTGETQIFGRNWNIK